MRRLIFTTSLALATLSFSLVPPAYADPQAGNFKDRIPKELLDEDADFFTFTVENDNFGGNTDENYTSGVRLTYFDYSADPPWFADILDRYVPTFEINETTSTYYSFGQNLYTPENITVRTPDPKIVPMLRFCMFLPD